MTHLYQNFRQIVDDIITHVGKKIVIGVPLGLGKPVGVLNALYQKALADPSIELTIITGLTLSRPLFKNNLEKKFIEPILQKLLGDYEDLLYEKARKIQRLPSNISVIEFFLTPGQYLHNDIAQQDYISCLYTNVVRDGLYHKINVYGQQMAANEDNSLLSASCNSDLFKTIVTALNHLSHQGKKVAIFAEVNRNLPFMYGKNAVFSQHPFSHIVDSGIYKHLFAVPREELSYADHMIGLYTSTLIKDGGSLQIGIGKLNNAVANALIFRQEHNATYQAVVEKLHIKEKFSESILLSGDVNPFEKGLYASTEMLSDEYIHLYKKGILKRRVYDNAPLQRLLNKGLISEKITFTMLEVLLAHDIIHPVLTPKDMKFLQKFGIFKKEIQLIQGDLILPDGKKISADLNSLENQNFIAEFCLGTSLTNGKILHAGFFLGSNDLYQALRDLSYEELQAMEMTTIARTNTITWSYSLSQLQRQEARFINSAMMISLSGTIISDGIENLREVSGVGGQYDFVSMSQHLDNARSIINCRATRLTNKGLTSNIVWDYPNMTIPRYLRDIVITEYGIADCRSKTDSGIIQEILKITDSRFQGKLLKEAKKYGKIATDYEIPAEFSANYPEKLIPLIKNFKDFFKPYPFGSDLDDNEQVIGRQLMALNHFSTLKIIGLIFRSFFYSPSPTIKGYLTRMQLENPQNLSDHIYRRLLIGLFRQTAPNHSHSGKTL